MTLPEWSEQIRKELTEAGFDVSLYQGFPLVKRPLSLNEGVRLLKFKGSLPADREIYAEGMLFVPAGSRREAERLAQEKSK